MRHRSRRRGGRMEADGSVDAETAPTDPCKTTERFCTSFHTPHYRVAFSQGEEGPMQDDDETKIAWWGVLCAHCGSPIAIEPATSTSETQSRLTTAYRGSCRWCTHTAEYPVGTETVWVLIGPGTSEFLIGH